MPFSVPLQIGLWTNQSNQREFCSSFSTIIALNFVSIYLLLWIWGLLLGCRRFLLKISRISVNNWVSITQFLLFFCKQLSIFVEFLQFPLKIHRYFLITISEFTGFPWIFILNSQKTYQFYSKFEFFKRKSFQKWQKLFLFKKVSFSSHLSTFQFSFLAENIIISFQSLIQSLLNYWSINNLCWIIQAKFFRLNNARDFTVTLSRCWSKANLDLVKRYRLYLQSKKIRRRFGNFVILHAAFHSAISIFLSIEMKNFR